MLNKKSKKDDKYATKEYVDNQIGNNFKRHVDAVFEQFRDYFKASFESIEIRLERIESKLDNHGFHIDNHEKRITTLELRNTK